MKVAVAADLHVHPWQEHATLIEGVNSRLLDCVSVLAKVRKYCLERGIRHFLILGDLFHRRGVVSTLALNLVVRELQAFKKAEVAVYLIPGNHDMADAAGEVHVVEGLSRSGLVRGVSNGEAIWRLGDHVAHAFAYCDSRDEFSRRLDANAKRTKERGIALFHAGFQGARVGSHLEYEVKEPLSAKKRLADRGFLGIFSGHYHAHQPIRGCVGWYVGSPAEFTRASRDAKSDKGFLVVDLEKVGAWVEFEHVALGLPRFLEIDDLETEWLQFGEEGDRWLKGNFVDVRWDGDEVDQQELELMLREAGARGWKLIKKSKAAKGRVAAELDPRTPPDQALEAWLEVKGDELVGLDRAALLALGKEFLVKATEE